ncbi:mediator of RNA polymerase II transcription subunit 15-like [Rhopalosiphum maidis]|uniref:mediator of RNA polymerase II transcription subunit 15-like n=1 Tax=Rhopalosiphum maidis TaxID=43146 RepID=UPI000EFF0636|nr:mediator of RNA polymerase II transcription subunit 15-like [Rhopalosiphum maidis]XP_026811971.1 mediator of RNA polymerase II transcription subunit 15-like [Rhopalosiphum maidis]
MSDDDIWRTSSFRHNVVNKIDEAIAQSGMPTSKNSLEMENHVFLKAKSKDEYLSFVARLLLHVGGRDMRGGNQMMNMNQNPGPVNATTLLQTLNNRPQTQNKLPGQMTMGPGPMNQGPMSQGPMNQGPPLRPSGPMGQGPMMQNPNAGPMGNQMGQGPPMPMSSVMGGPPMQNMPVQMPVQGMPVQGMPVQGMPVQGMPGVVPNNMPSNAMGRMQPRKMAVGPENVMMIPNQPVVGGYPAGPPRSVGSNQFLSHNSPSSPQQSPVNVLPSSNQMIGSPSGPQLTPSGQMSGPIRSIGNVPSPGSSVPSLNTPMNPSSNAGPSPLAQEDIAYREKVRQLSKYIEPLRKMIAHMGNEDVEKLSKMKKLLEILSTPTQRMPLETLLKCETALERLDLSRGEGGSVPPPQSSTMREVHPLIEVIGSMIQSPNFNHTLHRTFAPCIEFMVGQRRPLSPPPYTGNENSNEVQSIIPKALEGEIARLDQRFKVSLDPVRPSGVSCIRLLCWLDDKNLPCVPPINIIVYENYPPANPACIISSNDYGGTSFLMCVKDVFESRMMLMPVRFTVSHILDSWEMSVRQAVALLLDNKDSIANN